MSRNWRGNGSEEDRNCDGDCIKSDIERVGGKKTMTDRTNWRLPTESEVREK